MANFIVLCLIHEVVTRQVEETAVDSRCYLTCFVCLLFTVHRLFSALLCLPPISHVEMEVGHFTVSRKGQGYGSNCLQILIIHRS